MTTVLLGGELDLACIASLQELLAEQAEIAQDSALSVDLAEVTFIDSSSLGVLVGAFHHVHGQGRVFSVVNPSPMARRVLTVTGLDAVLLQS